MDLSGILYLWVMILTLVVVAMWVKIEVMADRLHHQIDYQRMVNHLTNKDLKEIKEQQMELRRQQEKQRLSKVPMLRDQPIRENSLNSEEIVYNSLYMNIDEITEDEYEESEYDPLENLQELSETRTKL